MKNGEDIAYPNQIFIDYEISKEDKNRLQFDLLLKDIIGKHKDQSFYDLFEKGNLDPNYFFYDEVHLIEHCIWNNNYDLFDFLIEKGANPVLKTSYQHSILFKIARDHTLKKFEKVFENFDFDIYELTIFKYNLLSSCCRNVSFGINILKYLLKRTKLDVLHISKSKYSLLDIALHHDNHEVIKFLLKEYGSAIPVNHEKDKLQLYLKVYETKKEVKEK